jgi:hypothetical protein
MDQGEDEKINEEEQDEMTEEMEQTVDNDAARSLQALLYANKNTRKYKNSRSTEDEQ